MAKAEVFRRKLQKRPDYTPPMSEQMENLRKAEASLQDAEKRLTMVRKWQPRFQHAVLEFHASVQRLKDIAATDVPNAALLLGRIVEALEAYLQGPAALGDGTGPGREPGRASPEMEAIATKAIADDVARPRTPTAEPGQGRGRSTPDEAGAAEPAVGTGGARTLATRLIRRAEVGP